MDQTDFSNVTRPASAPRSSAYARPLKAIYDVPAPAKLNLFLHITGRRADGYPVSYTHLTLPTIYSV